MSKDRKISPEGAVVRRARNALGMTQQELADRAGLSRPTVARIEIGDTEWLRPDSFEKVAKALGLTADDIRAGAVNFADPVEMLDGYLASPYAQIDKPTDDEIAWLRGMPPYIWAGTGSPGPQSISLLIAFRRSGRKP